MKLPLKIAALPPTLKRRTPDAAPASRITPHGSRITHPRQRGMALIITLILLSVTLVMAIAFLALSSREQNAVKTTTDTAIARYAAETALAAAQAQIVAGIRQSPGSAFNFGLLVSTNYINPSGFDTASSSPTNVNYDHLFNSTTALSVDQRNQNISNLWFLPRVPVFVTTNRLTGPQEFRYWLDLNQNARFDANGPQPQFGPLGQYLHTNGLEGPSLVDVLTNNMTGDPEWVGVLERPDTTHGPNNKFLSRYAFVAMPSGNTLDINAIHNQTITRTVNSASTPAASDGYFRNQGVGSWELNLAAFLTDLNTNAWDVPVANTYEYIPPQLAPGGNRGYSFEDARALLSYRYGFSYANLYTARAIFRTLGLENVVDVFPNDNIDAFTDGPLQISTTNIMEALSAPADADRVDAHPDFQWVGSDNPNRFFSVNEFFDRSKTQPGGIPVGFTDRLKQAGARNSTYDRYTFYRLLAQLGTDSTADAGKLNVNYRNVTNGVIMAGMETNLYAWEGLEFFTNAADRMLHLYTASWFQRNPSNYLYTYYGVNPRGYVAASGLGVTNVQHFGQTNEIPAFGVTRIPVYVNDTFVYSAAVNRVLQQAANIYDARTTNFFPSVYRPVFWRTNELGYDGVFRTNIYISGYVDVSRASRLGLTLTPKVAPLDPPLDVNNPLLQAGVTNVFVPQANAFGVPWIIGAKKGLPNFNMLATVNSGMVTRKLEVWRTSTNTPLDFTKYSTNQMYVLSITNNLGVSFWNSYSAGYASHSGSSIRVYAYDQLDMFLTNGAMTYPAAGPASTYFEMFFTNSVWPGSLWAGNFGSTQPPGGTAQAQSFVWTNWTYSFLPESVYRFSTAKFDLIRPGMDPLWEVTTPALPPLPKFGLMTTNRLQAMILDGNYVIDYVQLRGPIKNRNLSAELQDPNYVDANNARYQWSTNSPVGAPPNWGVLNQLTVSMDAKLAPGNSWVRPPNMPSTLGSTKEAEAAFFGGFYAPTFQINGVTYVNSETNVQAPYTPSRVIYDYTMWQANDPLVHYLASDLNFVDPANMGLQKSDDPGAAPVPTTTKFAHVVGDRYQPWGRSKQMAGLSGVNTNEYNLTYKDPLMWSPDNWDFPTNAFPSIGWIGRVHRGTPWQTVFLKSDDVLSLTDDSGFIGTNTWVQWTGNTDQAFFGQPFDAINMAPVEDRLLFDVFTARLNDNAAHGTLSVNQPNLAAWSAVFGGLVTLSNSIPATSTSLKGSYSDRPRTAWTNIISPAGINAQSSAMWQMFTNINATRADTNLFPNQAFGHVGDILSASALTVQSPFLNRTTDKLKRFGISDEMYEWLPEQTLGLLRCPAEPQYTIYCFGQTLRPAQGGLVQSGPFFGMITNYQVVAESASRAVIQVHAQATVRKDGRSVTNYSTTVESFNTLAPE